MDLFTREQKIYDVALATLLSMKNEPIEHAKYAKLVKEYGKLLKQFKQYRIKTSSGELSKKDFDKKKTISKTQYDVLTGIFSKRFLHENLERHLSAMSRVGDLISILLMDIDFFKQYNEIYGHGAGDNCLRTIAETLKSCLYREQDFVARYGGEEFMAILPHVPEYGAKLVAERMLDKVRKLKIPHTGSLVADHVTISIGLVTGSENIDGWMPSDFIKQIDEALFKAKSNGHNQYAHLALHQN